MRVALVVFCALALLSAFPVGPAPAAQEGEQPLRCRVGAYVTALHDFNTAADTFEADFWLWSVCPNPDVRPLESMEFVNANAATTSLEQSAQRGDLTWSSLKVSGTFRHDWNERNFPFDRQRLTIVMEEGVENARAFVYEADTRESGYDTAMRILGWKITGFALADRIYTHDTTFGDPELPAGGTSDYSRLTLGIDIARTELQVFFKLTAVVYVAFVLSLITYFIHPETGAPLNAQMALLAGATFAVAVNMVNASTTLADPGGLTLVDQLHIVVLLYILLATVAAVTSRWLIERGWAKPNVIRLNHRICAVAAVSFLAINVALVGLAARAG